MEYFSIEEKGSGQTLIVYKDKDGNTVMKEIKLPDLLNLKIDSNAKVQGSPSAEAAPSVEK